jgi:hypothetical protein
MAETHLAELVLHLWDNEVVNALPVIEKQEQC